MAQPTTGRHFVELLQQSQLLDAGVLMQLAPQLAHHQDGDPRRLAKSLIKNNLITEYQAKQLLAGRYKGFYIGKYKLLEVLGAGGMGKVFLAEQLTMERLVAVKVLGTMRRPERQQEILARFKREAKAVAALNHPNIVHAYDFAEEQGLPYIVMEFVEGVDAARLVEKFGALSAGQAAEFIRQAAAGLQHAHKAGLVHRDVKPGNLLIDAEGTVKLLDLGLVSALGEQRDDSLTVDQDQLGTVDYVAPEQAVDSHNVDARADIYSLGATCYAVLAARPPYPGKSTAQKLVLHQTEMPQPLRELRPDIPEELAAVVTRMLAKKREDRPQSMDEVQQLLAPFARAKQPAYDRAVIKIRRDAFEPLLGQAPEPGKISVETLAAPAAVRTDESKVGRRSGPASMIGMDSGGSNADDEFSLSGEFTDLALTLPPPVRRVKKKSASKKSAGFDLSAQRWLTLAGIAGGVAVMVLLSVILFTGEAQSTTTPEPAPVAAAPAAAKAPVPSATFDAWLKSTESLKHDPKLVAHYRLLDPWGTDLTVKSDAGTGGPMPLTVVRTRWGDGRWPRKGAILFGGPTTGQYAAFSTADARKLDLQKATTIALWFKVSSFTVPWQTLIAKGEGSWRLQRTEERGTLSFIIDKRPAQPANAGGGPELRLDGRTKVDDGRWHQVVIVLGAKPKSNERSLRMFIDGKPDGRAAGVTPAQSDDPVWIGANSDSNLRDQHSTLNFHGLIDELAIWNRALSDDEIVTLYTSGKP